MRLFVTMMLVLLASYASAQKKLKFHSQNYVGVLAGDFDAAFHVNSINGFQRGLYFGGIGTGIDFYYIRTVPLFLSVSRYLNSKPSSPFLTLDGGPNFVWDNSTANRYNFFSEDGDFTPSLYYGAHAGYKIGINKKTGSVLMSIGFTAKKIKEKISTPGVCIFPPCALTEQTIDYRFNRLTFRLGWMF